MTPHCPSELQREHWSVSQLELRKRVYDGANSLVFHAIDRRSGISIALKLYKRERLTEIERYQVGGGAGMWCAVLHASAGTIGTNCLSCTGSPGPSSWSGRPH